MIQELLEKFKDPSFLKDVLIMGVFIGATISAFFLGRLSLGEQSAVMSATVPAGEEKELSRPSRVEESLPDPRDKAAAIESGFVASKNGAKYHFPWCSGALRIKEENKIWFKTKEEAESAGYAPAANCKGL